MSSLRRRPWWPGCHRLEGGDVLGAAVRVAGVVQGVDADEDVLRTNGFRVGERERIGKMVLRAGTYVDGMSSPLNSAAEVCLGTSMSAVSDDPPKTRRSMSATTCRATPCAAATRRAD